MKFQSHVPTKFWSDCVSHAVFLINRTPSPVIYNQTPYQILYAHPPSFSNLKVFGCLCYASTISHLRTKFDRRADPCVFLGIPAHTKGYRLYNLHTKQIFLSINVYFYETIFPFHSSFNPSNSSVHSSPLPFPTSFDIPILDSPSPHSNPSSSLPPPPLSPLHPSTDTLPSPPVRRSTRSHTVPAYLQQYQCILPKLKANSVFTTFSPHHISNTDTFSHLSSSYKSWVLNISSIHEPRTCNDAIKHQHWKDAMDLEIKALQANNTWVLTDLPSGKVPIGCKWVYRVKYKPDGSVERFKARLISS